MNRMKILAIHVAFWIFFILFGVLYNVAAHHNLHVTYRLYWQDLTDPFTAIGYGRTILTCYLSLWLFEYLLARKQYFLSVFAIAVLIAFDIFLRFVIEQLFIGPVFNLWQFYQQITIKEYIVSNVFFSAMGIFLCFVLKVINDYVHNEDIRHEKNQMELQFLRSQINPHFLFNSFNNLYALALTEPEKTPDVLLKLADLTRYMLYESNAEQVLLSKEIAHIHNFVELQSLRYEENFHVELKLDLDQEELFIAPLILISFVENAFKHGTLDEPDDPVTISLVTVNNDMTFFVRNKISWLNKDSTGGIGIKNVRRRLELLYPNQFDLKIVNNDSHFCCTLLINLAQKL